ncbi:MAG: DEAD/DEAH box helicase [Gammaproteobacteria bacterium]|nr:DEAD/DEAH box helicase [Gammaproteobacteria bacterium]
MSLDAKLLQAREECAKLRKENERLKRKLANYETTNNNQIPIEERVKSAKISKLSPAADKLSLYLSLFHGRTDVYAKRWESKNGRSGYSPVCAHEWNRPICKKPTMKCSECKNRELLPITKKLISTHLKGDCFVGIYPLLKNENCWFLALDFDKDNWQEDAISFLNTCALSNICAALERSQSGNGCHIWIFFSQAIPAYLARRLGCSLLTSTMKSRYQLGLDSYDRLFPNQDTMPRGGFGNLIALPLQGNRRRENNSVFLNSDFEPHTDQWAFLSSIKRLTLNDVTKLLNDLSATNGIIDVREVTSEDSNQPDPWALPIKPEVCDKISEPLPTEVKIVSANMIYIEKHLLPSVLLNKLKILAAFQNPEFYKTQAMRLPVYNKPRIIGCADEYPKYLALPRGCLSEVVSLLEQYKIIVRITDKTHNGIAIKAKFSGKLRLNQQQVVHALKKENIGVLSASTGFGKTVIAAKMIATRKVSTLILVHRQQLMDQWRERLSLFLNIPIKDIGVIGGGKSKPSGKIDIAMLQSLFRKGEVNNIVEEYGQLIVDECHHISAFSFEQVLKHARAKFVLGLTATPIRKDGHHPIILMQCGPILYKTNNKDLIKKSSFEHIVKFRHTDFEVADNKDLQINDIYAAMITNQTRNNIIFNDIVTALEEKRSPLVLTERTQHLEYWANTLSGFAKNIIILKGGMSSKERAAAYSQIKEIPAHEERIILATGRYIGEGFDDARLDTLFLTMPISWQGTLQQYIGRLHREYDNKHDVVVYDYVDGRVPTLERMYRRRLKKYNAIGYSVKQN